MLVLAAVAPAAAAVAVVAVVVVIAAASVPAAVAVPTAVAVAAAATAALAHKPRHLTVLHRHAHLTELVPDPVRRVVVARTPKLAPLREQLLHPRHVHRRRVALGSVDVTAPTTLRTAAVTAAAATITVAAAAAAAIVAVAIIAVANIVLLQHDGSALPHRGARKLVLWWIERNARHKERARSSEEHHPRALFLSWCVPRWRRRDELSALLSQLTSIWSSPHHSHGFWGQGKVEASTREEDQLPESGVQGRRAST